MEVIPSVIIVSSSNTKPESLIKLITKKTDIQIDSEIPGVIKCPWTIDTKYYTANVNLVGLTSDFNRTDEFNNTIEALIVHMNTNKESGLDDLKQWDTFQKACNLDIKLLICNYCTTDTKIRRNEALEWCLTRGFEFVELYPSETTLEDQDKEFEEKTGVDRIIEALQSHTWSNLVLKKKMNPKAYMNNSNMVEPNPNFFALGNDMADDFTELFSHLSVMKDSLQNMPMNQRKQCAEQMVTAFWKALGGDEEDLLDM